MSRPSRRALTSRLISIYAVHELRQIPKAHLRVPVCRRDDRILLRFDDEPSAIRVAPQNIDQHREIDGSVTRHGERAVDDRLEKAPVAVACEADDVRTYVLAMHVANA